MTITKHRTPDRSLSAMWRGLGALLALAVLLFGVPAALAILSPVRLPSRGPTWDELLGAWTRPDDGTVVWGIMTVAAWVCWLVFALQVIASLSATIRAVEVPAVRGLGWMQRGATTLVTTALLLLTTPGTSTAPGHGESMAAAAQLRPGVPQAGGSVPRSAPAGERAENRAPRPVMAVAVAPTVSDPGPDVVDIHPAVSVRQGDTLWDIAERHLGSGHRYVEIVGLNLGQPQADGRSLTDEHWIEPGWVLRLPMDATNVAGAAPAAVPDQPDPVAPAANAEHVVVPGDTLWGIAAEALDDGARFPEIYDLNAGVTQPDGSSLVDPDLIRPGWHLALPVESTEAPTVAVVDPETAVPASPRHSADVEPRPFAPAEDSPARLEAEPQGTDDVGAADSAVEAELDDLEAEPRPSATLILGMTSLGAALLLAELDRRRRRQRRLRRSGERIPVPSEGSPAIAVEAELRRAVVPLTRSDLDLVLRRLLLDCRALGRHLPRVDAVLLEAEHVDLVLGADEADAVAPFALVGPRRWRARLADLLSALPRADEDDVANPYPVLVGVGQHGMASVLVNLEAAGTLSIVGDPDMATAALRAIACELACQPLDGHVPPFVTDELADLIDTDSPDLVTPLLAMPDAYEPILATYAASFTAMGVDDVLSARAVPGQIDGWLSTIHVGSPVPAVVATPWSGLVTVALGEHRGWRLVVDPDGTGRLDPAGLDLAVARLDDAAYQGLLTALRTAREEPVRDAVLTEPSPVDEVAAVRASLEPEPERDVEDASAPNADRLVEAQGPTSDPGAPRVLILGRPHVLGHEGGVGTNRERRLTEIVAFLALHPGASAEAIDEILGRGQRVTASTRNAYISRARAWLGRAPDGTPYLPILTAHDDYRLHPAVRTDWDDFRELLRAGVQADVDGAPALRAALDLVRGRPFADAAVGTYDWAEPLVHQMIDQIVDAAHLYAVLVAGDDYRSVREALAIALSVDPCNELLHRDAIAAAHRAGDAAEVDRLVAILHHRILDIDPDDEMEDETVELLDRVRPRWR